MNWALQVDQIQILVSCTSVFSAWQKHMTIPYTWTSLIQALEAPAVGEGILYLPKMKYYHGNSVWSVTI